MHWIAVAALVVLQFTIMPMLIMMAADTTSRDGESWPPVRKTLSTNNTVIFKTTAAPTLAHHVDGEDRGEAALDGLVSQ